MPKCKSCGAEIRWVKTFSGKSMPIDAQPIRFFPDTDGNEIFVTDGGAVIHGVRASEKDEHCHIGYISHFATCPYANQHRKGGDPNAQNQ